jgi:hypothetical protein
MKKIPREIWIIGGIVAAIYTYLIREFIKLLRTPVLILLVMLPIWASAQLKTNVLFYWDNPGPIYTNLTYTLWWSTNLSQPSNQWSLLAVVPQSQLTNVSSNQIGFWTNLTPANYFFTVAWSNSFWGNQSFFSQPVGTDPFPPVNQSFNLTLHPR